MPLRINVNVGLAVMVYGFVAAAAKVMPLTSVFAEMDTLVVFERANVAVSTDPLGTVVGVQFVPVFHSPELELRSHVALPAWLGWMQSTKINALKIAVTSGSGVFTGSRRMIRDVQPCPAFISLIS